MPTEGPCGFTNYLLGFVALPLLVLAGAAFFMLEIVIRIRFNSTMTFILTASFLQIQTDLLKRAQPLDLVNVIIT